MLRITKTSGIETIKWFTKEEVDSSYKGNDLDSFVIIPGVTSYQHIYSKDNWIVFDGKDSYIGIEFSSVGELERYFIQLLRDIKLNQITNVSIDTKSN
jgi:hypothetical protein